MTEDTLKEKLEMIGGLIEECLAELGVRGKWSRADKTRSGDVAKNKDDIPLQIVNRIGDCDEHSAIQKQVLDKRGAEGRLLLPFYISQKYLKNSWLTSGDIERITSDLGVKIYTANASHLLIKYRKYFESQATRKMGQPTPYRLNRNGVKRFQEILHEKKD